MLISQLAFGLVFFLEWHFYLIVRVRKEIFRKNIENIDERLDAIERIQIKQRDASLRIAKLQEEVERLKKLWF